MSVNEFSSTSDSHRVDLRTRVGRESEVLAKIRSDGGFSIFGACENMARANAIHRLNDAGRIKRIKRGLFPWCPYRAIELDT